GYVRMLDEREPGEVIPAVPAGPEDRPYTSLSVWWRMAIAFGGPAANFLLAIFVYWLLFVVGSMSYAPLLGEVATDSPLGRAGVSRNAEILSVDGTPTRDWQQVNIALASRMGDSGVIEFSLRQPGQSAQQVQVPIDRWHSSSKDPDLFGSLGISVAYPALVATVLADSPARRAGFQAWDLIESVDGAPIETWRDWVALIQASPGKHLNVRVKRAGQALDIGVTPETRSDPAGEKFGYLGVGPHYNEVRFGPLDAIPMGIAETWDKTVLTLGVVRKMFTGQVSVQNLNSPIMIAKVAGDSARAGWQIFVGLAALLSISLGVLNLLPIPILDGGHILFCLAEIIRGKPVPERAQIVGTQVGLFLVAGLMMIAIYNDITRLL
ncbi:MAG: RIP metalloprotease RseP, partial [Pseudomonadales bacterium]|nr:RIP metalloprotease RseP [Pseudomonadales bacterium]